MIMNIYHVFDYVTYVLWDDYVCDRTIGSSNTEGPYFEDNLRSVTSCPCHSRCVYFRFYYFVVLMSQIHMFCVRISMALSS